jgi:AcrR family transcriptional regulator
MTNAKRTPAKRGRPRSEEIDQRWQRILDVTATVLLRDGYTGTSIAKIAREGGVSKKTIYAKYSDKTELAADVLKHLFQRSWDRLALIAKDETRSLADIMADFATTACQDVTTPAGLGLYRILIAESPMSESLAKIYQEVKSNWDGPLSKVLQASMDRGELRQADPVLVARTLYQLAVSDLRERALLGRVIRRPEIAKTVALAVEIVLAAYASKPA